MPMYVFDYETDGIDPAKARPVSVAVVALVPGGEPEVVLDTLLNPGRPIDPATTAIHGITDADVEGAPAWFEVSSKMVDLFTGATAVAAYNAPYDATIFLRGCVEAQIDTRSHPIRWLCPLTWARCLYWGKRGANPFPTHESSEREDKRSLKLEAVADFFEVEVEGEAHSALPDALTTAKVMTHLRKAVEADRRWAGFASPFRSLDSLAAWTRREGDEHTRFLSRVFEEPERANAWDDIHPWESKP